MMQRKYVSLFFFIKEKKDYLGFPFMYLKVGISLSVLMFDWKVFNLYILVNDSNPKRHSRFDCSCHFSSNCDGFYCESSVSEEVIALLPFLS